MNKVPQTGNIPSFPKPTDYIAGVDVLVRLKDGDWTSYEPDDEKQYVFATFDTMSCTTFSFLNSIEMQFNYLLRKDFISLPALNFLKNNGYLKNGKVNFSDRFTAIMSGTTKQGNYFQKVGDSGRNDGLIPESMLPFGTPKSWDEWHNPNVITEEMRALGLEFKKYFDISYSWVFFDQTLNFETDAVEACENSLKESPLWAAIPLPGTHAVAMTKIENKKQYTIFDTYPPFDTKKKWDDPIHYAMKVVVREKQTETIKTPKTSYKYFTEKEVLGLKESLVRMLDEARGEAGIPFKINSGLRTQEKNESVGGVEGSSHLTGLAADIRCLNSGDRIKMINAFIKVGFRRIGIADSFIHVDIDESKPQDVLWLYK